MKLINEVTKEKLRGGFYTPLPIARFIIDWALHDLDNASILEPSCGDGAFIQALKESDKRFKSFLGIELEPEEAEKAVKIGLSNTNIRQEDFLKYYIQESQQKDFDVLVGNPPYIRYQFLDKEQKSYAKKILEHSNVKHSKLMNAWVTFVVGGINLLKSGGKVGLVLPAELLQVGYASQIREYLARELKDILIITFEELVFEEIQQEVVLLMGTKNATSDKKSHTINHLELPNAKSLDLQKVISQDKRNKKRILDFTDKWTYYFLNKEHISLLSEAESIRGLKSIGELSDVQVGITTGANKFFTVSKDTVDKYDLHDFAKPLVGRSVQVRGLVYDNTEFKWNKDSNNRSYILDFTDLNLSKAPKGVLNYLKEGEQDGIHEGYKCSIRDKWYQIPSIWSPDNFLLRRNNAYPKLVSNHIDAYSTDTMHRIKIDSKVDKDAFAVSFYNSVSFAFAEIFGRSYGGGVLEILPSEAEKILLPYSPHNKKIYEKVDGMLKEDLPIEDILDFTDQELLIKPKIISSSQSKQFREIWENLRDRRLNRGKS